MPVSSYAELRDPPGTDLVLLQLIIVTGLPASGKSTRAKQLHDYLYQRIQALSPAPHSSAGPSQAQPPAFRLHLISDQTLSISRAVYDLSPDRLPAHTRSANASEKDARAALFAAVKRVLSPRDIVILDGLNYIKGWRYQLHTEAKNLRTPSAVLQIGCAAEQARQVNQARLQAERSNASDGPSQELAVDQAAGDSQPEPGEAEAPYAPGNWENLVFRYEEPNAMNRWDSPLFTLIWEDDERQTQKVFGDLWDALAGEGRKVVRPNQSAAQKSAAPAGDFLYVLDRETQDIVRRVLEAQHNQTGGTVDVSAASDKQGAPLRVELPGGRKIGLPQMQRLRRAYVGLNRGGLGLEATGNLDVRRIREGFVGYLNVAFENE
jgi:protein KTI12